MNTVTNLQVYKTLEREAHITSDDVLNKVTQEVLELLEAKRL